MENIYNFKSVNFNNYYQSDLFLDEKNAIYVYEVEKIIRKDKTYSLVRELRYFEENFYSLSPKETEFYDENIYIYDDFLNYIMQILDITLENQIAKDYFLENNKPINIKDLAQISKWEKSSKIDLKKGSVFIEEEEIKEFETKYKKAIKTKHNFFDAHCYLYLDSAIETLWKWRLHKYPVDIIELSTIGENSLYFSISNFFKKLKKIEDKCVNENDIVKYSNYVVENNECLFDECEYADDLIDEYYKFIETSKKNIKKNIIQYLINQSSFSDKNGLFL